MKINLEYLAPSTIKSLYNSAQAAWNDSDDLAEELELINVMEQLNKSYVDLTGEKLEDFETFF